MAELGAALLVVSFCTFWASSIYRKSLSDEALRNRKVWAVTFVVAGIMCVTVPTFTIMMEPIYKTVRDFILFVMEVFFRT